MSELSRITACIVDNGMYLGLAWRLAGHFKRLLYCNASWVEAFPVITKGCVGDGFENIETIDDYWAIKDEIQLFIFPDLYRAGEQLELESQGYLVWGSRHGDKMEIFRRKFMAALDSVGLRVPKHQTIRGLSALRDHLHDLKDKYIKISRYRGSMETFHWRDWTKDKPQLDLWTVKFGPVGELMTFLVFDAIDSKIEVGADSYNIDGDFPSLILEGYEWKDKAYFGALKHSNQIAPELQEVNEAFKEELAAVRYRNFISSEIRRVSEDEFYYIDATRRFPCPGSGSQMKLYKNLPEIIYYGAQGELIQPNPAANFSVECFLTSSGDSECWALANFEPELREWLFCGGNTKVGETYCWPPDYAHGEELGWLVHIADSPTDVIEGMLAKTKLLPDGVTAHTESLVDLLKEIHEAEKQGLEFTPMNVPEPETIIEDA